MEYEIKKAGIFRRVIYWVRCKLTRLWYRIWPKSWKYSDGYEVGAIIHIKGVEGIYDGDYVITGESGKQLKNEKKD